ncbi:MAG TPA: aminoglycoside phosphotransferase family protein [Actinophytocola sp.]|jgi:hypothetical protein|nr:aminoglycoside phosphotransferase family protein [Actinophytocola sp.]
MSISREAAVAAAVTLAADLGLREVEPRLLRDSSNVLLHLRPYPLVARVATLTALRPGVHRWLASDIELATYLHGRDLPVVRPATDPPAGPHDVGGITIALWRYVEHDPSALVGPASLVSMLAELHAAARDFPGTLAADGPRADLDRVLTFLSGSLDPGLSRLLAADGARLGGAVAALPAQPLHGDAHPGNVLVTPSGPMWNDFEDAWRGPPAWDYACVAGSGRPGDWASAVSGRVDEAGLAMCRALREVFAVAWQQLLAHYFPARAGQARAALAEYAERHDQGYYDGTGVGG